MVARALRPVRFELGRGTREESERTRRAKARMLKEEGACSFYTLSAGWTRGRRWPEEGDDGGGSDLGSGGVDGVGEDEGELGEATRGFGRRWPRGKRRRGSG